MSTIQIWLSDGSDRFRFPVNPESFQVSVDHGYEDIEITQFGEVTQFGNRKQMGVSFSSFFPRDFNQGYVEYASFPSAYDGAANKIINWMHSKKVLQLTMTMTNVTFPVTIRSFNYSEKGGEPGDVYYDIELKEYRSMTPRIYDPNAIVDNPSRPYVPINGGTSYNYTVKNGDTLSKISFNAYGDASRWREIYNANLSKIGNNPNKIVAGMVIVIPSFVPYNGISAPISNGSNPTFTIRSGDTLYEIASAFTNTTVNAILSLNPTIKPTNLSVGSTIKLPVGAVKLRDPRRL